MCENTNMPNWFAYIGSVYTCVPHVSTLCFGVCFCIIHNNISLPSLPAVLSQGRKAQCKTNCLVAYQKKMYNVSRYYFTRPRCWRYYNRVYRRQYFSCISRCWRVTLQTIPKDSSSAWVYTESNWTLSVEVANTCIAIYVCLCTLSLEVVSLPCLLIMCWKKKRSLSIQSVVGNAWN